LGVTFPDSNSSSKTRITKVRRELEELKFVLVVRIVGRPKVHPLSRSAPGLVNSDRFFPKRKFTSMRKSPNSPDMGLAGKAAETTRI
jgi:hypothetical protein